jgi:hypothetical protein
MPSQIIHALSGQDALKNSVKADFPLVTAAFNLGCQGPDIFSHNRRTKPFSLAYSRLLHRHEYGLFCRYIAENLHDRPSALLESWFYGFVTHQNVDRIFHPYIINRSFITGSTGIAGVTPAHFHAFLERILDVCILQEIHEIPLASFDSGEPFVLPASEIGLLAQQISAALGSVYPGEASTDSEIVQRVENAFSDTIYFYGITNPVLTSMKQNAGRSNLRRFVELGVGGVALLYPEELDSAVDWLNLSHNPWQHPVNGERSSLSAVDLFRQAVMESSLSINLAASVLSGETDASALEESIGNDCLSVSGSDGKIGAVRYYDPFDLGTALLVQADKRKNWLAGAVG